MHFTREPIIETIISPKEGCKLLVRSSRGQQAEEYYVDAVEVVSFGRGFFFRSVEKPKAFLLPVSDYEVLEVKEPRLAIKNASPERQNIKIGGGKDASLKLSSKEEVEDTEEVSADAVAEESADVSGPRSDRRRDRRRRRHRRGSDDADWQSRRPQTPPESTAVPASSSEEEVKVLPSLIPPPTTLISQTLNRYKPKETAEEAPQESKKEETGPAEGSAIQRTAASPEDPLLSSTYFIPVESDRDFYAF